MTPLTIFLTIFAFTATIILILWRPKGLNEAIPATLGAMLVLVSGSVSLLDIVDIGHNHLAYVRRR
jgi:arsenical pump membrane protein